jgi:hypothetical protein
MARSLRFAALFLTAVSIAAGLAIFSCSPTRSRSTVRAF